jgi:hypothetical protein
VTIAVRIVSSCAVNGLRLQAYCEPSHNAHTKFITPP